MFTAKWDLSEPTIPSLRVTAKLPATRPFAAAVFGGGKLIRGIFRESRKRYSYAYNIESSTLNTQRIGHNIDIPIHYTLSLKKGRVFVVYVSRQNVRICDERCSRMKINSSAPL